MSQWTLGTAPRPPIRTGGAASGATRPARRHLLPSPHRHHLSACAPLLVSTSRPGAGMVACTQQMQQRPGTPARRCLRTPTWQHAALTSGARWAAPRMVLLSKVSTLRGLAACGRSWAVMLSGTGPDHVVHLMRSYARVEQSQDRSFATSYWLTALLQPTLHGDCMHCHCPRLPSTSPVASLCWL